MGDEWPPQHLSSYRPGAVSPRLLLISAKKYLSDDDEYWPSEKEILDLGVDEVESLIFLWVPESHRNMGMTACVLIDSIPYQE